MTVAAEAAGGHLDPANTGKHEGPEGGASGRPPVLVVNMMIYRAVALRRVTGSLLMK